MSEQIHDHVSAFIDDELSAEECAFLVRRFERDPEAREKLVRYSLIGSALREELPHPEPDILRRRVQAAVNGTSPAIEPAIAAPPPVVRAEPPIARTGKFEEAGSFTTGSSGQGADAASPT